MNNPDCIFCKIVAGTIPSEKIWENEQFLGFLDIMPVNLGHMLLVPKAHCADLFEMPSELLLAMGPHIKMLAEKVRAGTAADGINIGMNNGAAAGQIVPHAHIHIIPRFAEDGLESWPQKKVSKEELAEVAEKIRTS